MSLERRYATGSDPVKGSSSLVVMAVRLQDVAARAGVSLPTASRVLSGSDYPVAEALRARVEEAARDLDYVPNAQARALMHGSEGTVGVLVGDVGDPYFSELVHGIHTVAGPMHLMVTTCSTDRDVDRELEYFRLLQAHRTAVVIVAGSGLLDPEYRAGLAARARSFTQSGGRVVHIGHPEETLDRVLVDNVAGARRLAEHLVERGHRHLGVIAGQANVASTEDRLTGLRDVIRAAGGSLVVRHGRQDRDGGWSGAEALLDSAPDLTALVGTADQMAIGALAHLRASGRTVPGRIAVAGFNDIAVARDLSPSLTTVRLPLREMGAAAMTMALRPHHEGVPAVHEFDAELIIREST